MPTRYGRQIIIDNDNGIQTINEQLFANFQTVKSVTIHVETIHVKDDKEILAEFLKLLDMKKKGLITNPGIQCIENSSTGKMRIEKTWTV